MTDELARRSRNRTRRELGAFTCVAIGLTTIVGSGIYALPPTLAASA